ncbi:hypothetical protein GCM10009799_29760 [Nocardiopsis rhodophaea]|uniref:Uncharacterized protein n=1 Tax=Nocardiopsis rhodophaea TaxID=280238 RepID=A0ABN2T7R2_9ACTN
MAPAAVVRCSATLATEKTLPDPEGSPDRAGVLPTSQPPMAGETLIEPAPPASAAPVPPPDPPKNAPGDKCAQEADGVRSRGPEILRFIVDRVRSVISTDIQRLRPGVSEGR